MPNKKYIIDNEDIMQEWCWEENDKLSISPFSLSTGSGILAFWKCKTCKNIWKASINNRVGKGSGCPYCANLKVKKGFNDLATTNPELVKEWDYEKNGSLLPTQVVKGSDKKVWWKCQSKSHSWCATINSRVSGNNCPICSNQIVVRGINDLFTLKPELYNEWDFDKNSKILPYTISTGSTKQVWWKCKICGFSWKTSVYSRTIGHNCPSCGIKKNAINRLKTVARKNSLSDNYPDLVKEWDFEKNSIDISLISVNSNKKIWWKCSNGHSFQASVSTRTRNQTGCPFCNNQKVLVGINDLQTLNPTLAEEWDYEKNFPITPSDVFSHSSKFAWWKCKICGNSWRAKINNRANNRNCPQCNFKGSSFTEQTIFYYIKKCFCDAISRKHIDGFEYDIYIPSLNIAIEYDGSYYHSKERVMQREIQKNYFSKEHGITLIRLREIPLMNSPNAININCDCSDWIKLEETCRKILEYLNSDKSIEVSISKDYSDIVSLRRTIATEKSLAFQFPHLLKEWDYEKNKSLMPEYFSCGSTIKVWWKCSNGHSWQTTIYNRSKGHNCPTCAIKNRSKKRERK